MTFADLSGGTLPRDTIFDGHSFAPQVRGEPSALRAWVYNQLVAIGYVRDEGELNEKGELFDMSDASFPERLAMGDHPACTKLAAIHAKLKASPTAATAPAAMRRRAGIGLPSTSAQKKLSVRRSSTNSMPTKAAESVVRGSSTEVESSDRAWSSILKYRLESLCYLVLAPSCALFSSSSFFALRSSRLPSRTSSSFTSMTWAGRNRALTVVNWLRRRTWTASQRTVCALRMAIRAAVCARRVVWG